MPSKTLFRILRSAPLVVLPIFILVLCLPAQGSPGFFPTTTWQPLSLPNGISSANVNAIAVHATNAATVFLATTRGVFVSTDYSGASWRQANSAAMTGIIAATDGQHIYAWGNGILRSTNGGSSWDDIVWPAPICGLCSLSPLFWDGSMAGCGTKLIVSCRGCSFTRWGTRSTMYSPC